MAPEVSRDSRDALVSFSPSLVLKNKNDMKKGPWTTSEDMILVEYVKKHGEGNWNTVQRNSGLMRCGKSCRLRWANHLRPNLKKCAFSIEEEKLIIELHAKLGNKWARMAAQLPGRTDNEIKNYWNTRLKRRQHSGLPIYPQEVAESPNPNPSPFYKSPDSILPRQINNPPLNLHQTTLKSSFTSYPLGMRYFLMEYRNSLGNYGNLGLPLIQSPVAPTTAPSKVVAAVEDELGFPTRTGLLGDVFRESEALAACARKSEMKFIAVVGNQNTNFASEDCNKNKGDEFLMTPGEGGSSMEDDLLSQLLDNFPLSVPIPEWIDGRYKSDSPITVNGTTSMMQGQPNAPMYNPDTVKGSVKGSCLWNNYA